MKGALTKFGLLKKIIRKLDPDIIINAQTQVITWVLPFVCKEIPKIMEIHFSHKGMEMNMRDHGKLFVKLYFFIATRIYSRYNRFVVLTDEDKYFWKLKNVSVINNFSNLTTDRLSELNAKRVICTARYHEQKRLDLLIDAWSKIWMRHKGWTVEVFGVGPDKQKLQQQINRLGLSDSFILHDAVDDVKKEYFNSSIFALTSEHEGFGLVLLEAMIMGLPICLFDIVGTGWASNGGNTALICEFGDVDKFAKNLSLLIDSPELRLNLRNNALKELPKLSKEHIMSQWNELINDCVNSKHNI